MRSKTSYFILVLFVLVLYFPTHASAALSTITPDGGVTLNVLSAEDEIALNIPQNESVTVKKSIALAPGENSKLELEKSGGNIVLSVTSENGKNTMDVTNFKDEVIQIEERPEVNTLSIKVNDGHFLIDQQGLIAKTDYEITIDPADARLLLDAPSGKRFLSITPREATRTVLRAKTLDNYSNHDSLTIVEDENNELTYSIKGQRTLNFFDLVYYPVDVTANVSALTGEILKVEQPIWLRVVGFLFA